MGVGDRLENSAEWLYCYISVEHACEDVKSRLQESV